MTTKRARTMVDPNPLWYKDAVIYELHVRTFYDSNGDGVGDFKGLAEKLDYLEELGITAVWLLPFFPSPLRDDGYDISNYVDVNPIYGTLKDFQGFLDQAHLRNIRVIIELALNHTSDQHPWFQRARKSKPGSVHRDYYVWSDTPNKYREARLIFPDYERSNWTWDAEANAYYWHRFYSSQPDLNYDNPRVRREILKVVDFWLAMGVDGLRLDAVPYLYEREGTSSENLPETHEFLRELRRHVDSRFTGRMLLAEANQWPEDAVTYLGQGDECHMAFHFPLMPRLFMALYMEDQFPIVDILAQTPEIPETCQWATFLRNHDELTLEMVTDEERDYMYRVYATDPQARINVGIRRRLAPLLGNHRRRIELLHALLFALPGTPVLYYGNEIGMGDNIYLGDRDGVRTPFQWSGDRNAGFSKANPQRLCLPVVVDPEYHYEAVNVEAQRANPYSLWNWTRRLVELRRRTQAFGRGTMEFLHPDNGTVLAFIRHYQDERVLVVANLSRYVQSVSLDLSAFVGFVPTELFGRVEFPVITDTPYTFSLGPHGFYYFSLEVEVPQERPSKTYNIPELTVASGYWSDLVLAQGRASLEAVLPTYFHRARWFGGKARRIKLIRLVDVIPFEGEGESLYLIVTQVTFGDGGLHWYVIGAGMLKDGTMLSESILQKGMAIAHCQDTAGNSLGVLYDALGHAEMARRLGDYIVTARRSGIGRLRVQAVPSERSAVPKGAPARMLAADQSNTSARLGDQWMLKMFRRLEPGIHPDWEIGRYLTEAHWPYAPKAVGVIEYHPKTGDPMLLTFLQQFVENQGDAWQYVQRHLAEMKSYGEEGVGDVELSKLTEVLSNPGGFWSQMVRLGSRLGELHGMLSQGSPESQAFRAEPFSDLDRRSVYQTMRMQALRSLKLLRRTIGTLSRVDRVRGEEALEQETLILEELHAILEGRQWGQRIRCHGDLHLGQVLVVDDDFVFIDFEGEPTRTMTERRGKRSPLRDVAGLIRSLQYAVSSFARSDLQEGLQQPWLWWWYQEAVQALWYAYQRQVEPIRILPGDEMDCRRLLRAHMLDKALYELFYELNQRPDWAGIPLEGIVSLMKAPDSLAGSFDAVWIPPGRR